MSEQRKAILTLHGQKVHVIFLIQVKVKKW